MNSFRRLASLKPGKSQLKKTYTFEDPELAQTIFGLNFRNPVGLAAGFDKNALYLNELELLGFSHVEIGTVTPLPQEGNPKPRLIRLPDDEALINRMGFNNHGVKLIAERLIKWKLENASSTLIIGGNIGKNKATPNEEAWKDYERCFNELADTVDYFVVNVSSPNTPGLRELQEKDALKKILSHLQTLNKQRTKQRPILLKIAPDLTVEQVDDVIELALEIELDGLVVSNTTLDRSQLTTKSKKLADAFGAGGLSGKPVKNKATELLRYISSQTNGKVILIASGGIFSAEDAREKLNAGAKLIQVWTGFIYEGPALASRICRGLAQK